MTPARALRAPTAAALVLALAACAQAPDGAAPAETAGIAVAETGPRVPTFDGLAWRDAPEFDDEMLRVLNAGHARVGVLVDRRADLGSLPVRLERWLSAVQQSGGRVVARAVESAGGPPSVTVPVPVRLVDPRIDPALVAAARIYEATLLYDRGTGLVDRVVFDVRRAPGA